MIRYLGIYDDHGYIGGVSEIMSRFGLFRQKGYVDSRDVPGYLTLIEDGSKVFEVV
jgi:hypothetical protein